MTTEPQLLEGLTAELLPRVLPSDWRPLYSSGNVFMRSDRLLAISTAEIVGGKRWLHVSCSRSNVLPSWNDLCDVKKLFIGAEKQAVSILPREPEYVNLHAFCLHLWHCIDGDVVPDMRRGGTI